MITADFKPNSNFPPRKEILEAAEKQISMWIKEWDKLIQFASSTNINIQSQSGINIENLNSSTADNSHTAQQIKRKNESNYPGDSQHNSSSLTSSNNGIQSAGNPNSSDFHRQVSNPRPPPLMMPHGGSGTSGSGASSSQYSDYQGGSFDQDINDILELDGFSDFPIMGSNTGSTMGPPPSSSAMNTLPISQNPHLQQQNYSNYSTGGENHNYGDLHPDYSSIRDSNTSYFQGNDNYGQNLPDNSNLGANRQNFQGSDHNYSHASSDNYQNGGDNYQNENPYPSEYPADDKSNLETFDDLDCATDYLPNTHILGKRKVEESYFDAEHPSKYSKTEPM